MAALDEERNSVPLTDSFYLSSISLPSTAEPFHLVARSETDQVIGKKRLRLSSTCPHVLDSVYIVHLNDILTSNILEASLGRPLQHFR